MGHSPQAERLCETLLEHGPACHWVLDRDLTFRRVYGNSKPFFSDSAGQLAGQPILAALPEAVRGAWEERIARVLAGEMVSAREPRGGKLYFVTCFPVREGDSAPLAGGFALEVTPWSATERELRSTALNVLQAQESERARLAHMLHDEVGQCLSAAGLHLDLLRMDMERTVPSISARTAEIQQMLETVMDRVREFSYELDPAVAERAGLYPALDRLVGRLRKTFPGTLRLMADGTLRVPAPVASALYKIAQQALDNAIRHSGCTQLEVLLKSTRQGPTLEVRDNGRGFDSSEAFASRRGLGILIMEQYATQVSLSFAILTDGRKGTVVRATYTGGTD